MWRKNPRGQSRRQPATGGRLRQLVESGDTQELARRAMTLQSVLLDLHRQLASVQSQEELARTMALALTGSFASERLLVLRSATPRRRFKLVAERGDVPADLREAATTIATSLAPFLPHLEPLVALDTPATAAMQAVAERCKSLGLARAAWLSVDGQVDWIVLVGPKLSGHDFDEFDRSMLQATFDAAGLACSRLLLVGALQKRNHELTDANQRLLQIDDLKSAILTGVSHELRTPLTRILSYGEALRDGEATPQEHGAFVDIILRSTQQLSSHVDQALSFAELIGGRTQPRQERVGLHEIVDDVVLLENANARERRVDLQRQAVPLVTLTDPDYVRMILKNLLDNALKFTPAGGTVRVELFPEDGGATLRICDTGPGIREDARERIWRLFELGDISLRREKEGLGLGLALVQRLALELQVEMALERTGPEGSIFRLHFAEAVASESSDPAKQRRDALPREVAAPLRRR